MRTVLLAAVTVLMTPVVFGLASAQAIGGSFSSQTLGAGVAAVGSCDASSTWTYSFGKDADGHMSSIRIANIGPGCLGGSMHLTLVGPVGVATGTPVGITDCSARCSVDVAFASGRLYPSQIASVDALIVGP